MTSHTVVQGDTLPTLPLSRLERLLHVAPLGHALFWSWNVIFVLFTAVGLLPTLLPAFVRDLTRGLIPIDFVITLGAVLIIPAAATVAGIFLRKRPERLLRLFYGLEMPVFFALLLRLFLVRQLTAPLALLASTALIGLVPFAWELARPLPPSATRSDWPRLVALSLLMALTAYVALILAFYAVPLAALAAKGLFGFGWAQDLARDMQHQPWVAAVAFLGLVVLAYTTTLFVGLPVAALLLYTGAFTRTLRRHARAHGKRGALVAVLASVAAFAVALVVSDGQPQARAFALLARSPTSDTERRALLDDSDSIRAGLVNAYLARYRYFGEVASAGVAAELWADAFGRELTGAWAAVQSAHDFVAAPFLYGGDIAGDPARAEQAYERFFDTPIQQGEQESIVAALVATYARDGLEAGLLDREAETIWVAEQQLELVEYGGFAEVTLHEALYNQTPEQQEGLYYFALPESAVVTGLWLGSSPRLEDAFRFVVAPRGAAQQVYRGEVQRRMDPAIVEQVGPRQYRLKVFPVLPDDDQGRPRPTHLFLRFMVMQSDGVWPMPELIERRNLFWTSDTRRTVHRRGDVHASVLPPPGDGWLWPALAAQSSGESSAYEIRLGAWSVRATPVASASTPGPSSAEATRQTRRPVPLAPERRPVSTPSKAPAVEGASGPARMAAPLGSPDGAASANSTGLDSTAPSVRSASTLPAPTTLPLPPTLPALPELRRVAVIIDRSRSMADHAAALAREVDSLRTLLAGASIDLFLTAASERGVPPRFERDLTRFDATATVFYGGQSLSEMLRQFSDEGTDASYDFIVVLTDDGGFDLEPEVVAPLALRPPLWVVHLDETLPRGYADPVLALLRRRTSGVAGSVGEALRQLAAGAAAASELWLDGCLFEVREAEAQTPANSSAWLDATEGVPGAFAPLAARALIRVLAGGIQDPSLAQLDLLHSLAREHEVVTPYSSMLVLVDDWQRERLREAEEAQTRFDREVESGKEALSTPFGDLMVSGVPEPEEWLLIVVGGAALLYALRRRRLSLVAR